MSFDGPPLPTTPLQVPSSKPEMTQEMKRERLALAVRMLDDAVTRAEKELADAEGDGGGESAQRARIRLERVRTQRADRVAELADAGGAPR
jgi:hypothetical protein